MAAAETDDHDAVIAAPESDDRDAVIAGMLTHLATCSESELRNLARMTHSGSLKPENCRTNGLLSHYPLPETRTALHHRLTAVFQQNSKRIFNEGPRLVQTSAARYRHLLTKLEDCPALYSVSETCEMSAALVAYLSGYHDTSETVQLFPGSDAEPVYKGLAQAWEVWAEFVVLESLFVFAQHLGIAWDPSGPPGPIPVTIFRTDKMPVACALLHEKPHFLLGRALFPNDHQDWHRLKVSRSVKLQGEVIMGDMEPSELLYDVACHLGMDPSAAAEEQIAFIEARAEALAWVLKLVRQGIFASFLSAIIKVIFGQENFMKCGAPHTRDGRHQLSIEAFPATDSHSDAELQIDATMSFSVRDDELNVVGTIPMKLAIRVAIGANGEVTGFQMCAEVQIDPKFLDEPILLFSDHTI